MYIHKDVIIVGIGENAHLAQACLKIPYRGVEISIAFDNGCGCMKHLGRADIRVYCGTDYGDDITNIIKRKKDSLIYCGGIEDLIWVKRRIDLAFKRGLLSIKEDSQTQHVVVGLVTRVKYKS